MNDLTAVLALLCETLDQNELLAFNDDSRLLLLVQKLLELQLPFAVCPDAARRTSSLLQWFERNQGNSPNVVLFESSPDNFGMKATELINEADAVIRVPKDLLITADCGNCPELYELCCSDSTLANMPNLRLTLNLLNERLNPQSKWQEYIASLPINYSGLMYFTADHFELLRPSPAFATCARLYCKLLGSYVYLYSKLFGGSDSNEERPSLAASIHFTHDNFTFAAFRWAISTVMTRQNNVPIGGGLALVPILDMLNHDPNLKPSVDFDPDLGQVIVYASRSFPKGEEFKIFYGVRPNHDLFVHNGFALAENPADSFYLSVPFKMVEYDDERRTKLIRRLGLERDCFKLTLNQPLPRSLLACMHIEFASDEVVDEWLAKSIADTLDQVVAERPEQLGADVWKKAYVWLAAQIGVRLRAYKERLTKNDASNGDAIGKQITTLLTCEKQILDATVAKLQTLVKK